IIRSNAATSRRLVTAENVRTSAATAFANASTPKPLRAHVPTNVTRLAAAMRSDARRSYSANATAHPISAHATSNQVRTSTAVKEVGGADHAGMKSAGAKPTLAVAAAST